MAFPMAEKSSQIEPPDLGEVHDLKPQNGPVEIVSFPMKNGWICPVRYVNVETRGYIKLLYDIVKHRIHGAAIYGNMR